MRTIQTAIFTGLLLACAAGPCGCQTQEQQKATLHQQYEKKASPVKLTAAQNMFEQGQIESAEKAVNEILKNSPDHAPAHLLSGRICLEQHEYGKARDAFEKAVLIDSQLSDGWFGLGVVAQSCDDHATALDFYQKAMEQNSERTELILAVVNTLELLNRSEEAQQLLSVRITANPSDMKLLLAAGNLASRLGQPQQAISLYRRAVTIQPQNPEALKALAMVYVVEGDWNNAADTFEKLYPVTSQEQQEECLFRLAESTLNAGRYRRAMECFDKLSVQRRDDYHVWLGMAISAMGISDVARARNCAQKTLSFKADCTEAQMVLGCADYVGGKYLTSLASFMPLMEHDEFGAFASFMAGRCYEKLGRAEQASAAFKKAAELNPQSPLVAMFLNKK